MVGGASQTELGITDDPIVKGMLKLREEHARKEYKGISHVFRPKTRFEFIRLSCIVVGIEFAYAAETAFVSPILLQIGIDHKHMTMVWSLSPLLGFFASPLLGSISDRCRSSLGRRRPVIIALSAGILAGLLLVPYGKDLGQLLGDVGNSVASLPAVNSTFNESSTIVTALNENSTLTNFKYAVILTILGTILLDFSADTCQTPARAYLLDLCIPQDHAKALSTFTIMAGLGGTVGYALGAIDWEQTSIGSFLGGNIPTVFGIVTVIFVICFFITITSFREISLKIMEKDNLLKPLSAKAIHKELNKNNNPVYYIRENFQTTAMEIKMSDMKASNLHPQINQKTNEHNGCASQNLKDIPSILVAPEDDEHFEKVSLRDYLKSIVLMPKSMRILCLTNLLCWMGHVCYCLYFTDFVGEAVFGGDPAADYESSAYAVYEDGVRFGCWGMSIYAFSCSVYSLSVEKLLNLFGTKMMTIGGILIYALGMLVLAVWPTKLGVLLLSSTAGILYATLFTMPYILLAKYHAQDCFKVKSGESVPLKQSRGLGTDIAIISSMVFVAQFIVSLSLGPLVAWLNTTSAVLYAACGFSICAAIAATNIMYI